MPAPGGRVVPRRSSRRLLVLLGATVLLPGVLLAALGVRTVQQERRLVAQHVRERLDRGADVAVRDLERELRGWQTALESLTPESRSFDRWPVQIRKAFADPGDAVVVGRAAEGVWVRPADQVLYDFGVSTAPPPPAPRDALLSRAESAEFRDRDYPRALRLYKRAAAAAATAAARADALHRVARTLRKMARNEEAMAVYRTLSTSHHIIGGVPADLLARYEMCEMLASKRGSGVLGSQAHDLYRNLVTGRWHLGKVHFLFYTTGARGFLELDRDMRGELARWSRVEQSKLRLTDAVAEWVHEGLRSEWSDAYVAIQSGPETTASVLLVSRAWLAEHVWPATFKSAIREGLDVRLTSGGGRVVFATARESAADDSGEGVAAERMLTDVRIPWRLVVTARDAVSFASEVERRQRVYVVMLGLLLALLASGSYLTVRVVRRELEIARLQADFVSAVSHEFRSPLTGIRQLSEMLARGRVPSDERRRHYYERILHESSRLTRLVENLLDLSRMEEGRREYRVEQVDTSSWLRSVVDSARASASLAAPAIVDRIPERLPAMDGDREALGCAVQNLIDNAVKYSPGRQAVWVEAEAVDGCVLIRVRDEGVGIGEHDRPRVFERFYRAHAEITREVKGAGLGLSLVAHIVHAHGGTVHCTSQLGAGSTFTIRLNAAVHTTKAAAAS